MNTHQVTAQLETTWYLWCDEQGITRPLLPYLQRHGWSGLQNEIAYDVLPRDSGPRWPAHQLAARLLTSLRATAEELLL